MRFRKGTLDHDNDGRMGGSMKETDMTKTTDDKPKGEPKLDPQSGMGATQASPAKAKKDAKEQFEEADKKGEPTQEDIDAATLSRSIRGW